MTTVDTTFLPQMTCEQAVEARTITAIVAGRFIDAAKHMQQSKWFNQVGLRSKRNVKIMKEGKL